MSKKVMSSIVESLVSYFYGESKAVDENYKIAVSYIITSVIGLVLLFIYAILHYFAHHLVILSLANLLVSIVILIILFISKYKANYSIFYGISLSIINIPLIMGSYYVDLGIGASLYWTVMVLLISEMFGNKTSRKIVLPLTLFSQAIVFYLDINNIRAEGMLFEGEELVKYKYMQVVAVTVTTMMLTATYRRILDSAIKVLEEKNDHIGQFVKIMCHDIANPLTVILGRSNKGYEKQISIDEMKEYFLKINQSGEIVNTILEDVRNFEIMSSEKIDVELIPTDINNIINNTSKNYEELCRKHNVDIIVSSTIGSSPLVLSDALTLEKYVMGNLIAMAIKFSPECSHVKIGLSVLKKWVDISISYGGRVFDEKNVYGQNEISEIDDIREFGIKCALSLIKRYVELYNGKFIISNSKEENVEESSIITISLRIAS